MRRPAEMGELYFELQEYQVLFDNVNTFLIRFLVL